MTLYGPHTALVCLGANTPDAAQRLADAVNFIASKSSILHATQPYPTAAEYAGDAPPYTNQLLLVTTDKRCRDICRIFKEYETQVRTTAGSVKPLVALDIDIVVWDKCILRPADRASAYFTAGLQMLRSQNAAMPLNRGVYICGCEYRF